MFNKLNIKWLAGIFGILLVLAVVLTLKNQSSKSTSRNRTFTSELVEFDSAKVNQITIQSKLNGTPVELAKKGAEWKIQIDGKEYNADQGSVERMLSSLLELRAKRIAANKKDQWSTYEVTDSLATVVGIKAGKKIMDKIYLGKFSYQQPKNTNPYMQQYGRQQGTMTSYIRMEGKKEVYAVDGMIAMSFNRRAEDFRDRTLIRSDKNTWTRMEIKAPYSSYTIIKQGSNWMIDGLATDSTKMTQYVNSLSHLSSSNFVSNEIVQADSPVYSLSIEGENMETPIQVEAFAVSDTTNAYALTSTLNKGSYFSGKKNDLLDKIFKSKEYFFPPEELTTE